MACTLYATKRLLDSYAYVKLGATAKTETLNDRLYIPPPTTLWLDAEVHGRRFSVSNLCSRQLQAGFFGLRPLSCTVIPNAVGTA